MTTETTLHLDSTDSPLETYLPKRRRAVEVDAPPQAEDASSLPIEPVPGPTAMALTVPKASVPDDDKEKLFADYLSTRSKQIKALARAYEYELRAHYEYRDSMRAIFTNKGADESEHAAMYEAYADS